MLDRGGGGRQVSHAQVKGGKREREEEEERRNKYELKYKKSLSISFFCDFNVSFLLCSIYFIFITSNREGREEGGWEGW